MPAPSGLKTIFLVPGDQLFDLSLLPPVSAKTCFYMAEDYELCTRFRYHKHKIILFLAAMRRHALALSQAGLQIHYDDLRPATTEVGYFAKLGNFLRQHPGVRQLASFAVNDKFFRDSVQSFCTEHQLHYRVVPSPMFVTPPEVFAQYLRSGRRPFMKTFYQMQRRRLQLLLDEGGGPVGGRWSFDEDNRRRLPKSVALPELLPIAEHETVQTVKALVDQLFAGHPGESSNFWLPTSRSEALGWLNCFVKERLAAFGPYEDALSERSPWLFHSVLTPLLNTGLLTPLEVVQTVISYAEQAADIPLNSLEGFVRQIIGWREFIFGIYQTYSEQQEEGNYFGHHRRLAPCWRNATTGIPPLDTAVRKVVTYGYGHHIERLMVISNTMLLCEVAPTEAHRWFMDMYVDSADWVMGPNVYGMGQFSDGGLFATKPYICGSNYWIKMGDAVKGEWQDSIDGLYWRFVTKHEERLRLNARLGPMLGAYARFSADRKERLARAAASFLARTTTL